VAGSALDAVYYGSVVVLAAVLGYEYRLRRKLADRDRPPSSEAGE
jgi:hypothetical protein